MKFASFSRDRRNYIGMLDVEERNVRPIYTASGQPVEDLTEIVKCGPQFKPHFVPSEIYSLEEIQLNAPIRPRRDIFCIGKNYEAHAYEFTKSGFDTQSMQSVKSPVPTAPVIFTKSAESIVGPNCAIRYPAGLSTQVDYEAELAIVIGQECRRVTKEDAWRCIWGYTIVNDVTARDLQSRHSQWFFGKSLDTFCPIGPYCVDAGSFAPQTARIACRVNNELRQAASISDLIFDIPTLISVISSGITLYPGDIIATGTPAGVGIGFNPPRFLERGDIIRIAIDGIGELVNRVE